MEKVEKEKSNSVPNKRFVCIRKTRNNGKENFVKI